MKCPLGPSAARSLSLVINCPTLLFSTGATNPFGAFHQHSIAILKNKKRLFFFAFQNVPAMVISDPSFTNMNCHQRRVDSSRRLPLLTSTTSSIPSRMQTRRSTPPRQTSSSSTSSSSHDDVTRESLVSAVNMSFDNVRQEIRFAPEVNQHGPPSSRRLRDLIAEALAILDDDDDDDF